MLIKLDAIMIEGTCDWQDRINAYRQQKEGSK